MSISNPPVDYRSREQIVFNHIPGMHELQHADTETQDDLVLKYPDAYFAMQIANNLFHHDRELSLITQRAYFAILNGEPIASARHRYNNDINQYVKTHMWDD